MLSATKNKGLRLWAATPLVDLVAGPGFEPGTFGDGYPRYPLHNRAQKLNLDSS